MEDHRDIANYVIVLANEVIALTREHNDLMETYFDGKDTVKSQAAIVRCSEVGILLKDKLIDLEAIQRAAENLRDK